MREAYSEMVSEMMKPFPEIKSRVGLTSLGNSLDEKIYSVESKLG